MINLFVLAVVFGTFGGLLLTYFTQDEVNEEFVSEENKDKTG